MNEPKPRYDAALNQRVDAVCRWMDSEGAGMARELGGTPGVAAVAAGSVGWCSSCGRSGSPYVETVKACGYSVPLYECRWCKGVETRRKRRTSPNNVHDPRGGKAL